LIWYFLTGKQAETRELAWLQQALAVKAAGMGDCPAAAMTIIESLDPVNTPVITQLSAALLALQSSSSSGRGGSTTSATTELWEDTLEDALFAIAALPKLAGCILRRKYAAGAGSGSGKRGGGGDDSGEVGCYSYSSAVTRELLDSIDTAAPGHANHIHYSNGSKCSANTMMKREFINLYLVLHSEHGGGNASAHTARLVGSTGADVFLSVSAALLSLSGPLHGGANGEALQWMIELEGHMQRKRCVVMDEEEERSEIRKYTQAWLRAGKKVPGFGHAVLTAGDPRVEALLRFASSHPSSSSSCFPTSSRLRLVMKALPEISSVLRKGSKVRAPYPNVDAVSGALLDCIITPPGTTTTTTTTTSSSGSSQLVVDVGMLLFSLGRAVGILTHQVLDRSTNVPLERPNSLPLAQLLSLSSLKTKAKL
jgi:citrate synthase